MKIRYLIYLTVALLMSSCYPLRRVGLLQERDNLPQYDEGEYVQYRLQPNDEIEIRVITSNIETQQLFSNGNNGNTNASYPYRIYDDGTIDIPFLDSVKIAGMTIKEAEAEFDEALKDYADDIKVKISLSTNTFCVIGDAGRGYFPIYKERLTIYQALALCGGINESADFAHVKILRRAGKDTKIVEFDIRSESIINSEYYYVYPNDIIYLDVSKRRFWAVNSYTAFLSIITSSLSLFISVWNVAFK